MKKQVDFNKTILLVVAVILVCAGFAKIEIPPFVLYTCAAYLGGSAIVEVIRWVLLYIMKKNLSKKEQDEE